MEAEHVDRASHRAQPAARQAAEIGRAQRLVQRVEIGPEVDGRGIRLGRADRRMRRLEPVKLPGGRGQARIKPGERPPIGLVLPLGCTVGRVVRQRLQPSGDPHHAAVDRQLGAQAMQLLEMEAERTTTLHRQRLPRHLGGDERIAVAIAADPAAHAEERRHLATELVLQVGIELGKGRQEGVVVIGEPVGDLVEHAQPVVAHQAGLPQGQHVAPQRPAIAAELLGREMHPVALVKQAGDLHLAVDDALAPHLGRMRGQHGHTESGRKEGVELLPGQPRVARASKRGRHGAAVRRRALHLVGTGPTDVVLVLGEVGQVREVAEGADDADRQIRRQAAHDRLQLAARRLVGVAVELHRRAADMFDQLEHRFALLGAHRVAQDAPQQARIVAQRDVLLRRFAGVGAGLVHGSSLAQRGDDPAPARVTRRQRRDDPPPAPR